MLNYFKGTIDFKGHRMYIVANIWKDYDTESTPASATQIEVEEVIYSGVDIKDLFMDLLSIQDLTELETLILEQHEEDNR